PGLWKVSKGDHVLWVFDTYAPLPKNLEWRSQQVEAVLAQSQEYLQPPGAMADVGFFSKVAMLPFAIGFKKNPDGAYLKDVVPAPVYARWQVLKTKYLGDDDGIERERPIFAADALYAKGLEQAGLVNGPQVQKKIDQLVKHSGIKKTDTGIKLDVDDPVTMLREFKKTPLEDAACFANTLSRLEDDLDAMRVRANAWAKGDLAVIEQLGYADRRGACNAAVLGSAVMQNRPGMRSVQARMREAWVAAAEKALAANPSTFATLQLVDMLDPQGYLAALQAKGYVVEKPE
ncbi:MAG: TraB/GumN family protein, partial [Duganella sp.]